MKSSLFLKLAPFLCFSLTVFGQSLVGNIIYGEAASDHEGYRISISSDGSIIALGSPFHVDSGHVRVFQFDNGTNMWVQLGANIDGSLTGDAAGASVSLSADGSRVAIGARGNDGNGDSSGQVRVFEYDMGTDSWNVLGNELFGEAAGDWFGISVALSSDGNVMAAGAIYNDNVPSNSGQVRVFQYDMGTNMWNQKGSDINGQANGDNMGGAVSLSSNGNIVAIGSIYNDAGGSNAGQVLVFEYDMGSNSWNPLGNRINGDNSSDRSGHSVSLSSDGKTVAIGTPFNSGGGNTSGQVRVLRYDMGSNMWLKLGSDIYGNIGDQAGYSVSLSSSGNIVAIGANYDSTAGYRSGRASVYQYNQGSNSWNLAGSDINGEAASDQSGYCVSLSSDGNRLAVGSYDNDGNGANSGDVRIFDMSGVLATERFIQSNFNLFPNPTQDKFTIVLKEGMELEKVSLYNNLGQFLFSSFEYSVDIKSLSRGLYFAEIVTEQGKATKKLVVK
ncbi:T9SS type A sorting domain-containing protein [Tamlana flava]|uniref:T9SS type A sorting domain-containing protein n=1 Tax=Tamlana flava TaxID=3158572 RepID=UPI00351AF901